MKNRIGLIIVTFVSIILIITGRTENGIQFQLKLSGVFAPLESCTAFFFNTFRIRQENKILKQKVVELSTENQILNSYKSENAQLRKLLDFSQQIPYLVVPANIINRELDPISEVCGINKGVLDEVKIGLPVITEDGIYGKIVEVQSNKALVQTLFNFNFRISGMDIRSGVQGIVRWEKGKGCILEHVPVNFDIKAGDEIISSGIGSIFPKGLNIGKVKEVTIDPSKLFYYITLDPACKFAKVTNVFVLKETALNANVSDDSLLVNTLGWKVIKTVPDSIYNKSSDTLYNKPKDIYNSSLNDTGSINQEDEEIIE
ncbi:MAG: rod shape-determining protein MreC [bacterium]